MLFDETTSADILTLAAMAIVASAALGLLPRSRTRLILIWLWSLLPTVVMLPLLASAGDFATAIVVFATFSLFLTPPWALLTMFSFNLVRRVQEIRTGAN